jgi:hypothetical protein
MNNRKFRINSEAHSIAIQNRLFELGCMWNGHSGAELRNTKLKFLFVDSGKRITFAKTEEDFIRDDCFNYIESTLDDLYVDENREVVVKLNDNKTYDATIKADGVYVDGLKYTHAAAIRLVDAVKSTQYHKPFKIMVRCGEHSKAIQTRLFKRGFTWDDGWKYIKNTHSNNHIVVYNNMVNTTNQYSFIHNYDAYETITLDDLYGNNQWYIHGGPTVKLSKECSATVTPTHVTVGCQTFSRENILKLGEELKKFKNEEV